jgi:hypothetical protein
MPKVLCAAIVCLLAAGALKLSAGQQPIALATPDQFRDDFANVPCTTKSRQPAVRALFEKMGAPAAAISVAKFGNVENLVTKLGDSAETVVVGAHYDFVDRGCGAIDNWSGIVTIAHLYQTLKPISLRKSVVFVAFDREELGLFGSKAMVNAIPRDNLPQYCAMINIDSFGLATPFALENASSPKLLALASEVAAAMQMPFEKVPIPNADADSSSFKGKMIPSVTLSGLTSDWQKILHSPIDQQSRVKPDSVYLGYRLALAMWSRIEDAPCASYR